MTTIMTKVGERGKRSFVFPRSFYDAGLRRAIILLSVGNTVRTRLVADGDGYRQSKCTWARRVERGTRCNHNNTGRKRSAYTLIIPHRVYNALLFFDPKMTP